MRRSLFAVLLLAAAPLAAQDAAPLMLKACVQCHDFQWIESQRKSEAAWRRTVDEMIWRGAPLQPGEADVLIKYLAGPPQERRQGRRTPELPPGKGRDLVAAACVQCHDLGVTTSQRKSLADWRRSVDTMVRLGAKLTGSEIQAVARYLAHSFGPSR